MKKIILFSFLLVSSIGFSQLKDISFTLSPMAEYTWWDDQAGLEDDFLYGGKVGFGFGEYLELSGLYMTNRSMNTDFNSFGAGIDAGLIPQRDIQIERYGGELKINLSANAISPYFTLGTGIQSIRLENQGRNEQIYASFGLGMRLALTDRINFLIEGRALGFQNNTVNTLLTPDDQSTLGIDPANFEREDLLNFGALAAVQIYLGGRKPGELSNLDRAYLNAYKNGFKGWSWIIEPSLAYIDFDSNSLYRNTYLAGGYFGVDFNEYVGVRGYFFQSMEDEGVSLDFDRLNMYGLEFRAKLNDGNGVTPYLILGGGQLLTQSNYQTSVTNVTAPNSTFANAGLGLDIPLGRNFLITGGVRAMASSERSASNLLAPEALQTHLMYNAGVKLQLGKKHKMPSDEDFEENKLEALRYDPIKDRENYRKLQQMKREYKEELQYIDEKLERAYQQNNVTRAVQLLERKKQVEAALRDIERTEKMQGTYGKDSDSGEYLKMTPDEFESLIDRILQGIDEKYHQDTLKKSGSSEGVSENVLRVEKRLAELEKELAERDQQLLKQQKEIEKKEKAKEKEEKKQAKKVGEAQDDDASDEEEEAKKEKSEADKRAEDEMKAILDQQDKEMKKREEMLDDQMKELDKRIEAFEKQIEKSAKEEEKEKKQEEKEMKQEEKEAAKKTSSEEDTVEESSSRKVIFTSSTETRNNVGSSFRKNEKESWMWDFLTYKGTGIYTGFNAGEQTTFNLGVRGHYGLGNSAFEAVPEAFVGFGDDTAYGLQMNAILPFTIRKSEGLKAYIGTGGGVLRMDASTGLNYNMIVGTYINWGRGRMFIDYTARNTFENNHFSIGYRLPF